MILPGVAVAEGVVPKGDPVLHVMLVISQKGVHHLFVFGWILVFCEELVLLRRRKKTDEVEVGPSKERSIVYELSFLHPFLVKIGFKEMIDGILEAVF